ncbi:MAG: putative manganese-dependent inorganic diphosphatase, partial [Clostridium sp.]
MKNVIYVTGHRNPDSDSICAAISYAEFKNKTGEIPAIPVRLGNVNRETQFILDYFNVKAPEFLETVKLKVEDLKIDNISPISADISLKMAWSIMRDKNVKTLPVGDSNDHLIGVLSISNLTSSYMDIWDNKILSKSETSIDNIVDTLSATAHYINEDVKTFPGKICVAAMQPDSMKEHVEAGDIVILGDRPEIQEEVINEKVSLMILIGSSKLSDELLEKAKKAGITVISTPHDSFTASRLIIQSIPVRYVMIKDNIVSFTTDDLVEEVKDTMLETRYRSYPVVDSEGKVIGTMSRYHLISNFKKKV